jgi:hypothetical protein
VNVTPSAGGQRVPTLLRRLVVLCPVTNRTVDTGFELAAIPAASTGANWLVDCTECGQDHSWGIGDAFLD